MKILIVEDEQVIRCGCRMVLEEKGHLVETSSTCNEGIKAVTSSQYDLILCDMKLPDKDGTEVIRIATHGQNNPPHIIMMSGYTEVNINVTEVEHAMIDYLPKPFTDKELLAAVENVAKRNL